MPVTEIAAVIFDHDGTLVDTEKQHYHAWNRLLGRYGHTLPESDYIRHHNGVPTIGSAAKLVERFNLDLTPEQLCHQKEIEIQQTTDLPPLMAGAEAILRHLHRLEIPLAVATGARFHEVERNLRGHQLDTLFGAICSSSHVKQNKPAPDVYLLAAEKLGLPPEQCLAVEDTPTGMRSAVAAGMPCVVIPSATSDSYDFSAATEVMASLAELTDWLAERLVLTERARPNV